MPVAELTTQQRTAIERRDVSIGLSAGAGCGKTFVLTERFISHLVPDDPAQTSANLRQLIAITFTDAAAREMRSRIRSACFERLKDAKTADEQSHWQRLLREIDAARVSTIHSFCASLLRAHSAVVGLDPLFGVLDQSDADVLQLDVIDDVLREQLGKLNAEALDLAAAYGLTRLKQQIRELIGHRHDATYPQWLAATPDEMVDRWRAWYDREAFPLALRELRAVAPIHELFEQLRAVNPQGKKPSFVQARAVLLKLLPRLQSGEITDTELRDLRESAKVHGVCTTKDWDCPDAYNQYRDACKALRDAIDSSLPKPFDPTAARKTAELGLALLRLTDQVVRKYESRKRAQGMLDFDDLLFYAHRLLTDANHAALREQLSDDLQLLLVDEFQDTDQLQVNLVLALCGVGFKVGRLFFVGDFKQSIYRFRGAKPQVFRDLREQVEEAGRLPLTLNFRSQPAVLEFVNALFCDMFQAAGQKYDALMASRPQTTARPSVEFLWTIDANKNKGLMAGAAIAARRKEAQRIARRLRSLLDETSDERPIVDKDSKQPRELQPGDVAILFRTLSDVQVYEEALRDYELDYYLVGGHAFYAQQEIFDVLNLLRAVASTADEVSLAGVLRSPFFALADETLFWLVESGGTLNGGLFAEHPPRDLSADEQQKVIAAADTIRHLRTVKDRVSIAALLSQALERTGYDAVLLAEFLGERKLANLHKLMEQARAADQGGVIDLDGFITQLAQLISQQPKESLAATLPEAANVIRLMTIHHAKGLEFPLVVVPDLDRPPRFGSPPAAFHPEFGPLVSPPDVEGEQNDSASGMSLFNAIEKAEELEERKRLLYVACTRAADYLILSSSLEAYDVLKGDWTQQLAERFELDTGKLCATLPSDYVTPTVRITPDSDLNRKPTSRARRPDLLKMLDEAHRLAGEGQGIVPGEVAPIPVNGAARRQFSFSRLTGQIIRGSAPTAVSPWTTDEQHGTSPVVDPRGLGTLVHDLLARVDLSDAAAISDWAEHLAPEHVLRNADEASRTAAEMVRRFFEAKRGRDIAAAKAAQREVEFLLAWPPDQANGDGTYLRGFIDCLYMDADNRWILVDYKTDNIPAAAVPRAAERYAMQLYVYAIAAERVLGQPPAALVLHFLKPGVEHVFAWDADARDTAINMVNNAIDDARQSAFRVQRSDAYRAPYSEP